MGFEDEVEQSLPRPCRQTNGRSKRTCELTSSVVPRGTSFDRSVEMGFLRLDLILKRLMSERRLVPGSDGSSLDPHPRFPLILRAPTLR